MTKQELDIAVTSAAIPTSSVWQAIIAKMEKATYSGHYDFTPIDIRRDIVYHGSLQCDIYPSNSGGDIADLVGWTFAFSNTAPMTQYKENQAYGNEAGSLGDPTDGPFMFQGGDNNVYPPAAPTDFIRLTQNFWMQVQEEGHYDTDYDTPGHRVSIASMITGLELNGSTAFKTTWFPDGSPGDENGMAYVNSPPIFGDIGDALTQFSFVARGMTIVGPVSFNADIKNVVAILKRPVRAGTPTPPPV